MPRENVYDQATDILKGRINVAFGELKKQYKSSNPYRQEPVEPRQRLYEYMQKTPQEIEWARQQFGPEVVDKYIMDMEQLKARYSK